MKYFKTYEGYKLGVNGVGSLRNSLTALKRQNINGRYVDPEILAQAIRNEYEAITGEKYEDEVQMSMDNTIADIIGHYKLDGPDFMAAWDKVVKESVNEASDQERLTHLRKFGIAPNNQPQNGAYIKQVSKPGKFFVDWKDAFDLGDVALEFVKSVGSISEFDIIDLKTMKRTGKQLDVKKGQLGNLRTTYGVRVNESVELDEATNSYKKGQRVNYQLDHKGGVGKFADATSKSKNIESGVIKKRTKGLGGTFKYELTNGLELYGSEIVGLTEAEFKHINKDEHAIKLAIKDVEKKARLKANRDKPLEYEQLSLNKIMLSKVLGREKLGKEHQSAWEKLKKEYSLKESVTNASNNLEKIFGTDQETMDMFQGIEDKGTVKDMIEFIDEFGNEEALSRYGIKSTAQVKNLAKTIMNEAKGGQIMPGDYVKNQHGNIYQRVDGKVGGHDAYVRVTNGKSGKRKTGLHDSFKLTLVNKDGLEESVNEAENYITDGFKVGDKIKTGFGEWEVIEIDYAPKKSFAAPFIFKGKDMKRVNIPNPPKTNKNAVGYKVTDGDKYPIIGFLYQYKDITKLATVGVDESVVNESYKGNFTDFKYDLEMAIDNMDISPKSIKSVKKKGKGYEVRLSSYMSDKSTWEKIGDTIGATLISFKPGSINIGIYE